MAETEDLKSFQCRFESDWGHDYLLCLRTFITISRIPNSAKTTIPRMNPSKRVLGTDFAVERM